MENALDARVREIVREELQRLLGASDPGDAVAEFVGTLAAREYSAGEIFGLFAKWWGSERPGNTPSMGWLGRRLRRDARVEARRRAGGRLYVVRALPEAPQAAA